MTQNNYRPSIDHYYLTIARTVATRSTCRHRHQGAILVKDDHVISAGYNGAPPGQTHCIDLDHCTKEAGGHCKAEGLHGESNAITVAAKLGTSTAGSIMYSVYSPCAVCCNMLKVAGVVGVYFIEVYSGYPYGPTHLKELGIWSKKTLMD